MRYRNLSHTLDVIYRRGQVIFGLRNRIYAGWWRIQLGRNVRFDGKCYFKRFPKSLISIGNNCEFLSRFNSNLIGLNRPCSISTNTEHAKIVIGDNCGFSGTVIGAFLRIEIGHNVRCGANTLITDSDWHSDDPRSREPKEIIIGDNVWLGVNTVILKGVTIGKNTLIGANSLVVKSIPANVIAAGNPCKIIKNL
jgi:acetyltransferase-like isoleucine patch superfamily enzyme